MIAIFCVYAKLVNDFKVIAPDYVKLLKVPQSSMTVLGFIVFYMSLLKGLVGTF